MKLKKTAILIIMAVFMVLPCQMASAANVKFENFTYTSTPNNENWKKVCYKKKADNEQNWYATLTASKGLHSTVGRAMFTSGTKESNSIKPQSQPVPLYKSTTRIKQNYMINVKKNSKCNLYITGDQNNKKSYKVTVSGRYTS